MTYYNTNKEAGDTLRASQEKARGQEQRVLEFFQSRPYAWYSREEIERKLDLMVTSAQRSLTNLTHKRKLEKSKDTIFTSHYGKRVHGWRLRTDEQQLRLL